MKIDKLRSTTGFIATDLDDAPLSAGTLRATPKVLQGGAKALARSATYMFAMRELRIGGAAAGISVDSGDRPDAIQCFVKEVLPRVAAGNLIVDPGSGVPSNALAELGPHDPRNPVRSELVDGMALEQHLAALGPVIAASATLGGLEGRTAVVEAGPISARVVRELMTRGAKVVSFGRSKEVDPAGADSATSDHNALDDIDHSGMDPADPHTLLTTEADIVFCGSRQGMIDGEAATVFGGKVLVPIGCQPVSAKGLSVLRQRGIVVLADFVSNSGPTFAGWPIGDASTDTVLADAEATITEFVLSSDHDEGPLVGACLQAEAFLHSWRTSLPFGRPLA